jgi:hypothetical protein
MMGKRIIVGVLSAALLSSGALVGVSFGGANGGITEPQVIELRLDPCSQVCRHYQFPNTDDRGVGQLTMGKNPISDADDNRVGKMTLSCVVSDGQGSDDTNWTCTHVLSLTAGPYTERGTVVTTGIYYTGEKDVVAVTGGTGAYENVRGTAVVEGRNYTLYLIP